VEEGRKGLSALSLRKRHNITRNYLPKIFDPIFLEYIFPKHEQ